jgi:hypothetical protein
MIRLCKADVRSSNPLGSTNQVNAAVEARNLEREVAGAVSIACSAAMLKAHLRLTLLAGGSDHPCAELASNLNRRDPANSARPPQVCAPHDRQSTQ